MSKNKAKYTKALIALTVMYFIIEIVVNFSIYKQLSVTSDIFIAESMELWGKIITGLGLGLIATRFAINKFGKNTYITFLACCIVTIPISFGLQTLLINYVVDSAEAEDKNKALLVVATHGTFVPFYNTTHWIKPPEWTARNSFIYPFGRMRSYKYANFWESRERELRRVSECAQKTSENTGLVKGVDKAFFPYTALLSDINESAYKQMITDYYMCAFEDPKYFEEHTRSTLNQTEIIVNLYYQFYMKAEKEYNTYKDYTRNLKEAKKIADERWRNAMDAFFGHKTTITPGLINLGFSNHPDVKRWYIEKTGITDLYPGDKNFEEDLMDIVEENLPYSAIPAYANATGEQSEQYLELTAEQIDEQGRKAYKAVVMPFIAMGLSAFFLLLNIILLVNFHIEKMVLSHIGPKRFIKPYVDYSKKPSLIKRGFGKLVKFMDKLGFSHKNLVWVYELHSQIGYLTKRLFLLKGFFIFVITWFLFWPSFKSGDAYDEMDKSSFNNSAKWIYYHEGNLIHAWDKINQTAY